LADDVGDDREDVPHIIMASQSRVNNNDTIEQQCNFKLRSKGDEINARGEERIQAA
jgi:hypothetical protein